MTIDELLGVTDGIIQEESNKTAYSNLVKHMEAGKPITPVIGAGLSCWAGYPLWKTLLFELCNNVPGAIVRKVHSFINHGEYEQAATELEKHYVGNKFVSAIANRYSDKNIDENNRPPYQKALPAIFDGPIVTTNFDRLLERLFPNSIPLTPTELKDDEEINSAIQLRKPVIIKLHGSVNNPKTMILTTDSYNEIYGNDPEKPNLNLSVAGHLKTIFLSAPPLFLGCGLGRDRTYAVLKACHGAMGFALLELPPETENKKDPYHPILQDNKGFIPAYKKRRTQLDDLNLQIIWYPYGKHDEALDAFLNGLQNELGKNVHSDPTESQIISSEGKKGKEISNPIQIPTEKEIIQRTKKWIYVATAFVLFILFVMIYKNTSQWDIMELEGHIESLQNSNNVEAYAIVQSKAYNTLNEVEPLHKIVLTNNNEKGIYINNVSADIYQYSNASPDMLFSFDSENKKDIGDTDWKNEMDSEEEEDFSSEENNTDFKQVLKSWDVEANNEIEIYTNICFDEPGLYDIYYNIQYSIDGETKTLCIPAKTVYVADKKTQIVKKITDNTLKNAIRSYMANDKIVDKETLRTWLLNYHNYEVPVLANTIESKNKELQEIQDKREGISLFVGPNDIQIYSIVPSEVKEAKVFFQEDEYVFAQLKHAGEYYFGFVLKKAFKEYKADKEKFEKGLPFFNSLEYLPWDTIDDIEAYVSPGKIIEKKEKEKGKEKERITKPIIIPKDTQLKLFFQQDEYVYTEWLSDGGRMYGWLAMEDLNNQLERKNETLLTNPLSTPRPRYTATVQLKSDNQRGAAYFKNNAIKNGLFMQGQQNVMGLNGENERKLTQNYTSAMEYYLKAAEKGNSEAQYTLGDCYYYGYGVEQDYEKAFAYYLKAAEQGDAEVQCLVGNCYYYGTGVEQDYVKAVSYYEKAAEQGNAEAQKLLGDCYAYGRGVEMDKEKAKYYYDLAEKTAQ